MPCYRPPQPAAYQRYWTPSENVANWKSAMEPVGNRYANSVSTTNWSLR